MCLINLVLNLVRRTLSIGLILLNLLSPCLLLKWDLLPYPCCPHLEVRPSPWCHKLGGPPIPIPTTIQTGISFIIAVPTPTSSTAPPKTTLIMVWHLSSQKWEPQRGPARNHRRKCHSFAIVKYAKFSRTKNLKIIRRKAWFSLWIISKMNWRTTTVQNKEVS